MAVELKLHLDLCVAAIRAAETGPLPNELAAAPLMENWGVLTGPSGIPVIWGKVIDHPCLGSRIIATPRLVALDAQKDWARSLCGWVRLGEPFTPARADVKRGYPRSVVGRALEEFEIRGFSVFEDGERLGATLDGFSVEMMSLSALPRALGSEDRP